MEKLSMESRVYRKIRAGIEPMPKFFIKMSIHSLFDQRNIYPKLIQIMTEQVPGRSKDKDSALTSKLYSSTFLNMMLREFHEVTMHLGEGADSL